MEAADILTLFKAPARGLTAFENLQWWPRVVHDANLDAGNAGEDTWGGVNAIADDDKNTRSAESLEAMAAERTLKDERRGWEIALRLVLSRPGIQIRTIPARLSPDLQNRGQLICCGRLGPLCLSVRDGLLTSDLKNVYTLQLSHPAGWQSCPSDAAGVQPLLQT
jgi:hypothetical protein